MTVIGYRKTAGRDAAGRRVTGYRLYTMDHVDGVCGYMPASVFLSQDALVACGLTVHALLGQAVVIKQDPYGQVSIYKVNERKKGE